MSTTTQASLGNARSEAAEDCFPDEMLLFAGAQCVNPNQFGDRGTDLWVLLAEDEHPYTPQYRRVAGDPDRAATLEALTAAIDALVAARERLLASSVVRERL